MVTIDDVRALTVTLPRSTEAFVRGWVKFRVGRIVYAAFSRDATRMGLSTPSERYAQRMFGVPAWKSYI